MPRTTLIGLVAALALVSPAATAAPPPPPAASPAAAATPTPPAPQPAPAPRVAESADGYSYQIDGRRDPFLSLLSSGSDDAQPAGKGEGIANLAVNDLAVRGVLKSKGTLIAMVQGPDKRAYVVHQGDAFQDGTIKAITPEGLVIVQQVNDPLSLVKQREVRKLMRSVEDGKQ